MKKISLGLVFTVLTTGIFAQNAGDFEIRGNDDVTLTILNYKGTVKDIVIPEKLYNMPVTNLLEGSFKNKGLTGVVIPKTITVIGNDTFRQNLLTSVSIPETVKRIGDYAFASNKLTAVTIPAGVEYIGNYAFEKNQISTLTVQDGELTIIDGYAFAGNSLTSVIIPDNVEYIGNYSFAGNNISDVILGNGAVFIGSSAFNGNVTGYGNRNQITGITWGNSVKYIGSRAFDRHNLSTVVIPESVVYIGGGAFRPGNPNSLASITIGKYVMLGKEEGYDAFAKNNNFDNFYRKNYRKSGKYDFVNNNWNYSP